jgi:hypothetical protein
MFTDPPLTKKQLGWQLMLAAGLAALGILSVDVIGAGRFGGIGPAQAQALGGAALLAIFGGTLVTRGDRLA